MAITFELKLCQSNFSRGIKRQKGYQAIKLPKFLRIQLIMTDFLSIIKTRPTVLALTAQLIETQSDYFSCHDLISGFYCRIWVKIFKIDAMVTFLLFMYTSPGR